MEVNKAVLCVVRSERDTNAMDFAVEESLRTGCPVHLLHAVPRDLAQRLIGWEADEQIEASVLWACSRALRSRLPDTTSVTTQLVRGPAAAALLRCETDARVVVVQREPHHLVAATHSWVEDVARSSPSPVVTVPGHEAGTSSATRHQIPQPSRRVVVGVKDPEAASGVVAAGIREAAVRDASLVVLHSWFYKNVPDSSVIDGYERETWGARLRAIVLDQASDPDCPISPDRVTVVVIHSRPAPALIEESHYADLLVLGRRPPLHDTLGRGDFGRVLRPVTSHASCPVMVVPAGRHQVAA
jgi:nucleotide-binding universal stress UspA family protein